MDDLCPTAWSSQSASYLHNASLNNFHYTFSLALQLTSSPGQVIYQRLRIESEIFKAFFIICQCPLYVSFRQWYLIHHCRRHRDQQHPKAYMRMVRTHPSYCDWYFDNDWGAHVHVVITCRVMWFVYFAGRIRKRDLLLLLEVGKWLKVLQLVLLGLASQGINWGMVLVRVKRIWGGCGLSFTQPKDLVSLPYWTCASCLEFGHYHNTVDPY